MPMLGFINSEKMDHILHYFLCYIQVPKAPNYSHISDHKLQILYAFNNKIELCCTNGQLNIEMKPFDNLIELDVLNEMGVFQDYEAKQYKHKSDQIVSLFTPSTSTPSSFFLVLEGGITNQMMMDELQSLQSYITKRFDGIHQDLEGLIYLINVRPFKKMVMMMETSRHICFTLCFSILEAF